VDLEYLHAGFLLGLRQKLLQQSGDGASSPGLTCQNAVTTRPWFVLLSIVSAPVLANRCRLAMERTMPYRATTMLRSVSND
jgi:hypothetical protein